MAFNHFILCCGGTACESNKGDEIYNCLLEEADKQNVKQEVQIVKTGCFGFCEQGPIVKVLPEESFYVGVKPEDAREIIAEQIIKGREVPRLLYKEDTAKNKGTAMSMTQ
ncbi:MAG: (2Fe-2S) ferredoxin domain-containing protein, partial [Treponema sp.]|nr:(2Fe-2S) ferredoxin domain-containing protein [Treponema sp.]